MITIRYGSGLFGWALRSRPQRYCMLSAVLTVLLLVALPIRLEAGIFVSRELRVTSTPAVDVTPVLGDDGISTYVVYVSAPTLPDGSLGDGSVFYQRIQDDAPGTVGEPIPVSFGGGESRLNDASSDHIVYSSYLSGLDYGYIRVYEISTATTRTISDFAQVREARIHGNKVAWVEGADGDTSVMLFDLRDIGKNVPPTRISGPLESEPATNVDIGDTWVVWDALNAGGTKDVYGYDLRSGQVERLAGNPADTTQERFPTTAGPYVAWEELSSNPGTSIKMLNTDTEVLTTVVDDGAVNFAPSLSGDLVSWEGTAAGEFDIYVQHIESGVTDQVTSGNGDQRLNNLLYLYDTPAGAAYMSAYADLRNGTDFDVYVSFFVVNSAPVADAGPDQSLIVVGDPVLLDGSQSYDDDGDAISFSWLLDVPSGSQAVLDDPASPTPSFVPDTQGDYTAILTVTDEWGASDTDEVLLSFSNIAPLADAGTSQSVLVGGQVIVDGSGSSDANNDPLTYHWAFVSLPPNSATALVDPEAVATSFIADVAGSYVVNLVVNDGLVDSAADSVTIDAINTATQVTNTLADAQITIGLTLPGSFKNDNQKNALSTKIGAVIQMIANGDYVNALNKLEKDILKKTNGCAETGSPDRNDWITACDEQGPVYNQIIDAIALLQALIP